MAGRQERFISSLSFQYMTNTLELDLSNIFGKGQFPNRGDIHSFISDEMMVTAGMLRGVQHHPRFPKVFIQFEREEDLVVVEDKVKHGLVMKNKGIKIFGYRCDKPMVTIVLNGQDMRLEMDEIMRVMGKYGKVMTCTRGKNNDLSTKDKFITDGTWLIRMIPKSVTEPPPETIYYFGESGDVQTWILSYDGVGSSCVLCGLPGHMGFRCRSANPKGGLGRAPAGLGRWTDVQSFYDQVAVDGAPPAPPGDVGGQLVQPGASSAGQSSSQPAAKTAGRMTQKQLSASQGDNSQLSKLLGLASKGWGRDLTVGRAVVAAPQSVKSKPSIPGLPVRDQEWKKASKNGGKGIKNRPKKIVEEISTSHYYDALTSDTDSDNEQPVKKQLVKQKTFAVNRLGHVSSSYGSRRNITLLEVMKQGQVKVSKKRHRNPIESRMKKKTRKNMNSKEDEQQIGLDVSEQPDEVVAPDQETEADSSTAFSDHNINNESEDLPAAEAAIENMTEASSEVNIGVKERDAGSVNPEEEDPGEFEPDLQSTSQVGAGGSSSQDGLKSHHLDQEKAEIAEKAAKMKAALEAQKEQK